MARTKRVARSAPRTHSLQDRQLQTIQTPTVPRGSRQARSRSPPATPTPIRARELPEPTRRSSRVKDSKQTPQELIPIACPVPGCDDSRYVHVHGADLQRYLPVERPAARPTRTADKEPQNRPQRTQERPAPDVGNVWERQLIECPKKDCEIDRKHLHADDQEYYLPRAGIIRAASPSRGPGPETIGEQEPMETENTEPSLNNGSSNEVEPSLSSTSTEGHEQQESEMMDSNESEINSFYTPPQGTPTVLPEADSASGPMPNNGLSIAVMRIRANLANIGSVFDSHEPPTSEQGAYSNSGSLQPSLDNDTIRNFDQLSVAGSPTEGDDQLSPQREASNEAAENDSEDLYGVSDTSERGGRQSNYHPPPGFSVSVGETASTGQAGSSDESKTPEQQNPAQASPRKSEGQRVRRARIASEKRAVSDAATQTEPSLIVGIAQQAMPRQASVEITGATDINGWLREAVVEDERTLIQLEPTIEEWENFWANPTNAAEFEETIPENQAQSSRSVEVAGLENTIAASTEGNRQRFYEGGGERLLYDYSYEFHMGDLILGDDTAVDDVESREPKWGEWTHEGEDPSTPPNQTDPSTIPAPAGGDTSILPGRRTTPPNQLQIPTPERPRRTSYVGQFDPTLSRDESPSLIGAFRDGEFLDHPMVDNATTPFRGGAPSAAMEAEWSLANIIHGNIMLHHQEEDMVPAVSENNVTAHADAQSDVQRSTSDGSTSDEVEDSDPGNIGWMM